MCIFKTILTIIAIYKNWNLVSKNTFTKRNRKDIDIHVGKRHKKCYIQKMTKKLLFWGKIWFFLRFLVRGSACIHSKPILSYPHKSGEHFLYLVHHHIFKTYGYIANRRPPFPEMAFLGWRFDMYPLTNFGYVSGWNDNTVFKSPICPPSYRIAKCEVSAFTEKILIFLKLGTQMGT